MVPYIFLIFLPFFVSVPLTAEDARRSLLIEKKNHLASISFFAILILLICFRSETIGADTLQYKYHFQQISQLEWNELLNYGYEIGFVVLYKLISVFTNNFRWVMIIVGILSYLPIAAIYCEENRQIFVKILLFSTLGFVFGAFSGGRQSIANGIMILSYALIRRHKFFSFLFFVILASIFHQSAIFSIFIYPLYHIKIRIRFHLMILIGIILIFILRVPIFTFLIELAPRKFVMNYSSVNNTGAFSMFFFLVVLSTTTFILTPNKTVDLDVSGLVNILLAATVIQMFASIAHGITRLNEYYVIFIPILIAKIIENPTKRFLHLARIINFILCSFLVIYFFYSLTNTGVDPFNIYPYRFYY